MIVKHLSKGFSCTLNCSLDVMKNRRITFFSLSQFFCNPNFDHYLNQGSLSSSSFGAEAHGFEHQNVISILSYFLCGPSPSLGRYTIIIQLNTQRDKEGTNSRNRNSNFIDPKFPFNQTSAIGLKEGLLQLL